MQIPKNQLKAALTEGRPQIGLWVALANPYSAEIAAGAGRVAQIESDATALAVMPAGFPSCSVVIMVTPLATCETASRKAVASTVRGMSAGVTWPAVPSPTSRPRARANRRRARS